jgi:hypothetical protein
MQKTLEEIADHIMRVSADPARLAAEAAKAGDTPFTIAQSNCTSIDERLVLFSRCFGLDAMPAYIRVCGWDMASLKKAAADLDRLGLGEISAVIRATLPTVAAKVSVAITSKRQAKRSAKRAYLKALAKARRK